MTGAKIDANFSRPGGWMRFDGTRATLGVGAIWVTTLSIAGCGGNSKLTQEQLIERATPSVVRIQGSKGGGTGFVVDAARRLVLTNAHVVAGRNSALKAQVGNETSTTTPVQVVASSPCDDLAVVKLVNAVPGLKALKLGTRAQVRPGESVTVLGFPGSLQSGSGGQAGTVVPNTGTVSQSNIQVNTNSSEANFDPDLPAYQSMIVHQAPVNHGDSGGPLLNDEGAVIGINTLTNEGHTQGQYYAIGIRYAARLLADLKVGRSHSYIGWDLEQMSGEQDPPLKEQLVARFENSAYGSEASQLTEATAVYLTESPPTIGMYDIGDQPGTPAEEAELEGKLIVAINKTPVTSLQDVCNVLGSTSPGQKLHVKEFHITSGEDPKQIVAGEQEPSTYTTEMTMPK
jgi:S1-C subfamily serine protease